MQVACLLHPAQPPLSHDSLPAGWRGKRGGESREKTNHKLGLSGLTYFLFFSTYPEYWKHRLAVSVFDREVCDFSFLQRFGMACC